MIEYHHMYDPNHCGFRFLQLLLYKDIINIEIEKLKIFDFYRLFPSLLLQTPLPKNFIKLKNIIKKLPVQYENIPNPIMLFSTLEEIQDTVITHLALRNIIDQNCFREGIAHPNLDNIPKTLKEFIKKHKYSNEEWFSLLFNFIIVTSLSGLKGLKYRTGLKEYRYE